MYRIDTITDNMLNEYFNKYALELKSYMTQLRDGITTIPDKLGSKNKILIKYKVRKNSPKWRFLNKYIQDANLRNLLCGSWEELLNIISDVENLIPNLEWQKGATKTEYKNGKYQIDGIDTDGSIFIDHFNEIMHWLFVDIMYETKLNKLQFIEKLGLKICPYCGRQHINIAKFPGYRDSKPNIDHFLPKSLYPFLSISFMNLIPCCHVCNEMANKGNYDPLKPDIGLYNPYVFNDDNITFKGIFNGNDEMDENSYDVDIICNPTTLDKGYKEVLKLLPFYQQERLKIQDIYINFTTTTKTHKKFLKDLGMSQDFLDDDARMIIGHPLDGRASQREFYKFKRDLFLQLVRMYSQEHKKISL